MTNTTPVLVGSSVWTDVNIKPGQVIIRRGKDGRYGVLGDDKKTIASWHSHLLLEDVVFNGLAPELPHDATHIGEIGGTICAEGLVIPEHASRCEIIYDAPVKEFRRTDKEKGPSNACRYLLLAQDGTMTGVWLPS